MPNPNKTKAPLTLAKDEPEVVDTQVEIAEDKFISISGLAAADRDGLIKTLRAHAIQRQAEADQAAALTAATPPLSERTLAEMKRGAEVSAMHAEKAARVFRTTKSAKLCPPRPTTTG